MTASLRKRSRRGSALIMTLVSIGALATMSISLLAVSLAGAREHRATKERVHAEYVAEAGLSAAVASLENGGTGQVGSQQAPASLGNGAYWVEADNSVPNIIQLTSTGVDDRAGARFELTLRSSIDSIWTWAAFGDEVLGLDSNAHVDSYDSTLGTYASQALNGSGSDVHAKSTGNTGSNGNITLKQNSKVWGNATCGQYGTTTVMGNAVCSGSTTPAKKAVDLPAISVPTYPSLGTKTVTGSVNLAAGNYCYSDFLIKSNSTVNVNGPANIVLTNFTMRSGAKFLVNATNGPVKIWVLDDFVINSNTTIKSTSEKPSAIEVNLLSDNVIDPDVIVDLDVIDFDSNAKMYGTIYAPNANVSIDSNFELFGSLVARSIDLDSNSFVHFDEALVAERGGGAVIWQRVAWRSLPYHP